MCIPRGDLMQPLYVHDLQIPWQRHLSECRRCFGRHLIQRASSTSHVSVDQVSHRKIAPACMVGSLCTSSGRTVRRMTMTKIALRRTLRRTLRMTSRRKLCNTSCQITLQVESGNFRRQSADMFIVYLAQRGSKRLKEAKNSGAIVCLTWSLSFDFREEWPWNVLFLLNSSPRTCPGSGQLFCPKAKSTQSRSQLTSLCCVWTTSAKMDEVHFAL